MIRKTIYALISVMLLQLAFVPVYSCADEKEEFVQLVKEDSSAIYVLAQYPEQVRNVVFEVCTQPQGIVSINDLQKKSQEQFRSLLAAYPKEQQQKVWDLTRYKGLIEKLVRTGHLSKDALQEVLKDYPAEIHNEALHFVNNHFDLLKSINNISDRFDGLFLGIIQQYPAVVKTAYSEFLNTPELISLLNSNMHMAVHLGNLYSQNPEFLKGQFNALNLELASQKAKDLEEWKQRMKDNPEAANELKQAAKDYASENGYAENDYYETNPEVIYTYVYLPYSFWFGYPWWYAYEWWYPYPYWYHWGFCYWQGNVFWYSPPSWFFVHWHFHHHHYFHNYPHITNVYINYYHGHHRAEVRNPVQVQKWYRENQKILPSDFMDNEPNRLNVIKNYGQFSADYEKENKNAAGYIAREEFLRTNADKYPHLRPAIEKHPIQNDKDYYQEKWLQEQPAPKQNQFKPEQPLPPTQYDKPRDEKHYQPVPVKPYQPPVKTPDREYLPKQQEKHFEQPKVQPKPTPTVNPKQNIQPVKPLPQAPRQQPVKRK